VTDQPLLDREDADRADEPSDAPADDTHEDEESEAEPDE
jgi:hypothetical protein